MKALIETAMSNAAFADELAWILEQQASNVADGGSEHWPNDSNGSAVGLFRTVEDCAP
jgi:hypothetical protein